MAMADEEYRMAFHNFSEKVRQVQRLTSLANANHSEFDAAVRELERAHCLYKQRRDALAQFFLPEMVMKVGTC